MPELSNERLADIRNEYAGLRDGLPPNLPDASGAASAFYLSLSLGEVVSMATELQQRRATVVTPEMVPVGTFIASSEHGVGVQWGDLGPLKTGDKIYAALSVVSHETGDGETEAGPACQTCGGTGNEALNSICRDCDDAPTDETQGVKREPVGYSKNGVPCSPAAFPHSWRVNPERHGLEPLFSLSQLEAVERERKKWEGRFWKMDANFDRAFARAETAEASLAALRKIVSECAAALPNGAFVSPDASLEFMAKLPAEIASVCARAGDTIMTSDTALPVDGRFTTFDLERSTDWPTEANHKAGRRLYNVIDWAGYHRGQIALTADEHAAINPLRALSAAGPQAVELTMTAIGDGLPTRDESRGEQTILTYFDKVGTWDIAFMESGWDDFDSGFALGVSHWMDITNMWPGVIAQVQSFACPPSRDPTNLLRIIADIREKSGLGARPMLSELADAIGEVIASRKVPAIKPIEWGKTSYGSPEAITVVGVFRIFSAMNGGWSVTIKDEVLRDADWRTNFATVETAKAAAQADYERRIRSALSTTEGE